ncbi:uncharacterized protein LOC131015926 [Salvia miltiorrhiza]|uniref:uncharacterized protein LOC131015926 n=1 Tax=Salvia miltiorrhiza TaxID=226208 RepID=UPI0025AD320A|nr:uncharacterized protein LOC131015926 [Salvia miltiorrhiza]
MVSLSPGTLQKLLQNVGDKEFRVAGEHRSALLQVISIVPSLEDDPWKSRGYYLRVSDSVHSAYVSVSDEDVELILSDMVQLGQFIYVTWLDYGSPVPVLRGIKPITKRRPCVGDPKDLISSDFLNAKKVETRTKSKGKFKKVVGSEEGSLRRLSFGNGKVGGGMESRRMSLDSARRGWDSGVQNKNGGKGSSKSKPKDTSSPSHSVIAKKALPHESPKRLDFSPLKSKNVIVPPNLVIKPVKSTKLSKDTSFPVDFNKVVLNSKKRSDLRILWDALPSTICDLGKEVGSYRKFAFTSAVRALEEASLSECVIRCMSMFAELCELSEKDTCGPLVEQFFSVHESIKKASEVIRTLTNIRSCDANDGTDCSSQGSESGICFTPVSKNASLWVQAAVETDLSKFSLYRKGGEKGITDGEKCHYVVIENNLEKTATENCSTKIKQSPRNSSKPVSKVKDETSHMSHSKKRASTTKGTYAERQARPLGLKHVAKLAENLLSFSHSWFLDYLEVSLNRGFGLRKDETSQVAVLLGQLKRVNQWLDGAFKGDKGDERIEKLKKELYRFLLDNVDSAVSNK